MVMLFLRTAGVIIVVVWFIKTTDIFLSEVKTVSVDGGIIFTDRKEQCEAFSVLSGS
jgi:hypothetical protein